ncbi:hypothetical protein F3I62_05710 [Pseudomonas sp. R-28-1W-6]|uniref:hypothetical protein n=1 Tax=Pseudomonas sp. R-28-1W-6 TaxID=2650101 RepID=UPI00136634E2|nr:hypothetical protein [Pseudomonas sp. R-28-1W-6]MWV11588.1 hypothetical protein [Pseudomonas sp. R-28-1W-6]
MKLEIARGLFLVGALGVTALAAAAWQEPEPVVLDTQHSSRQYCPQPAVARNKALVPQVRPDSDLLLVMFGLSQNLNASN